MEFIVRVGVVPADYDLIVFTDVTISIHPEFYGKTVILAPIERNIGWYINPCIATIEPLSVIDLTHVLKGTFTRASTIIAVNKVIV